MLNHTYQFLGVDTYRQVSTEPIPTGDVSVKMLFEADETKPGTGGNVTLWANGKQIGEGRMPHPWRCSSRRMRVWTWAGTTAAWSTSTTRTRRRTPSPALLKKVVFDLQPGAHQDELELHRQASTQAVGHGASG